GLDRNCRLAMRFNQSQAGLAHGLEMRAARDEDDICAGLNESCAEEAAGCAGAEDRDSHRGANCSATNRRWTLPVGVLGIDSTMCRWRGTLKSARRDLAKASSSFSVTGWLRTTAASTSSPQVGCGTPKLTASATAGCASSTSSISRGAIFSPPRLISSLIRLKSRR